MSKFKRRRTEFGFIRDYPITEEVEETIRNYEKRKIKQETMLKKWKETYATEIKKYNLMAIFIITDDNNKLEFKHRHINTEMAIILARIIPSLHSVHSVEFDHTELDEKSMTILMDIIRVFPTITTLDFTGTLEKEEVWGAFLKVFQKGTFLNEIRLSFCSMDSSKIEAFFEALEENKSLTKFKLPHSNMNLEKVNALVEGFKQHPSITSVGLPSNSIVFQEAVILANMFKNNSSLTSIDLSCNSIGSHGVNALINGFENNASLTSIDLSMNDIGPEVKEKLAKTLKSNLSLTSINLRFNQESPDLDKIIQKQLDTTKVLKDVMSSYSEKHEITVAQEKEFLNGLRMKSSYKWIEGKMKKFYHFLREQVYEVFPNEIVLNIWKHYLNFGGEEEKTNVALHGNKEVNRFLLDMIMNRAYQLTSTSSHIENSDTLTGYADHKEARREISQKKEAQRHR